MSGEAEERSGRHRPEPGITPEEARRAPQGASLEEVDRLVPDVRVAKTVLTGTVLAGVWTLVTVVRAVTTPSQHELVAETVEALKHHASA